MTNTYAITQGRLSFLGRNYVSPGLLDRLRGKEIDIYYDRRDISVIYLFLEGELVGEAYCTELLGQPMSIWEAQTRRKTDTEQAKDANTISLENRQRIQQEAASGRKALSLETKRLEKQRLLEQQRPEIHPDHVQAALRVLAHQQSTSPPPPRQPTGLLPPAVPEDDAPTTPIMRLQIRKRRSDDD